MAEKLFSTRIKNKTDTTANWDLIASTFIPLWNQQANRN